jgi:hypothetical protein
MVLLVGYEEDIRTTVSIPNGLHRICENVGKVWISD